MKTLFTFLMVCVLTSCMPPAVLAQNVKTYIPPQAYPLLPVVDQEATRLMPQLKYPHYFGALIEHESCISLKHSKCWSSTSELNTSRELGIGLGQITKAYNKDGSIRFDSLSDLRRQYIKELRDLSWSNVKSRPDLQIRAIVLMIKNNYEGIGLRAVPNDFQRLKFADGGYNSGPGNVQKNRRACGLAKDCDPNIWDDNVERYCQQNKRIIYGNRTACDIVKHHIQDTTETRLEKYRLAWVKLKAL